MTNNFNSIPVQSDLCPCGKTPKIDLVRVPRTPFMKIFLWWIPIKRYKCYSCMRVKWMIKKNERVHNAKSF